MKQTTTVRQGKGTVMLAYAGLTEYLNHRDVWVVCLNSETSLTYNLFTGPTPNEPPKPEPTLMTMEEIDSDYDANDDM